MSRIQLQHLKGFSRAIYGNEALAEKKVLETYALLQSALIRNGETSRFAGIETYEKLLAHLLYQAESAQAALPSLYLSLGDPFYQLHPRERVMLLALESGMFGYADLARWVSISKNTIPVIEIESLIWEARAKLSSYIHPKVYEQGRSPHCPPNSRRNPWVQRFLDEEIDKPDFLKLQTHLQDCLDCRTALDEGRKLFFEISKKIPVQLLEFNAPLNQKIEMIHDTILQGAQHSYFRLFEKAISSWWNRSRYWVLLYALSLVILIIASRS